MPSRNPHHFLRPCLTNQHRRSLPTPGYTGLTLIANCCGEFLCPRA
ncbi:CRISPR-associated protein Cas5 [Weissella cibaria]|nr:CRISPR-associated protein Cas5 [Weissella cibaria]